MEGKADTRQVHGGVGGLIVRRIICPNSSLSDFHEKSRYEADIRLFSYLIDYMQLERIMRRTNSFPTCKTDDNCLTDTGM